MKQTKLESAIEITLNYISGFILAYVTYVYVVMPWPAISNSPLAVTTLFTGISVIRSYAWRRAFNAGLHTAVHLFVSKTLRRFCD